MQIIFQSLPHHFLSLSICIMPIRPSLPCLLICIILTPPSFTYLPICTIYTHSFIFLTFQSLPSSVHFNLHLAHSSNFLTLQSVLCPLFHFLTLQSALCSFFYIFLTFQSAPSPLFHQMFHTESHPPHHLVNKVVQNYHFIRNRYSLTMSEKLMTKFERKIPWYSFFFILFAGDYIIMTFSIIPFMNISLKQTNIVNKITPW